MSVKVKVAHLVVDQLDNAVDREELVASQSPRQECMHCAR